MKCRNCGNEQEFFISMVVRYEFYMDKENHADDSASKESEEMETNGIVCRKCDSANVGFKNSDLERFYSIY